jgi:hypothetical protein
VSYEEREREYQEAKAAYEAALVRLTAAKKARPSPYFTVPPRNAIIEARRQHIWHRYVAGERDLQAMAQRLGVSLEHVKSVIREELHERAYEYGPPTRSDYLDRAGAAP